MIVSCEGEGREVVPTWQAAGPCSLNVCVKTDMHSNLIYTFSRGLLAALASLDAACMPE